MCSSNKAIDDRNHHQYWCTSVTASTVMVKGSESFAHVSTPFTLITGKSKFDVTFSSATKGPATRTMTITSNTENATLFRGVERGCLNSPFRRHALRFCLARHKEETCHVTFIGLGLLAALISSARTCYPPGTPSGVLEQSLARSIKNNTDTKRRLDQCRGCWL